MAKLMRTLEELREEAKRRTILFVLIIVTVAYCMSLTSNSVCVNIPIAIILVAVLRRLSFELEIRWRPSNPQIPPYQYYYNKRLSPNDPLISSRPLSTKWKQKIDSPVVESAIDELIQRIVAELVTDLWYSSITPDQEAPQEVRALINDVIGEISVRVKQVNLINLLTRDVVNVVANHLELYREAQASIGIDYFGILSSEERDEKIKQNLASVRKLHPAASSLEMECQVLQRLMGGVLAIVLKPEDAQCKVLRCFARELMACAVMRPVMNFANPRFINEIIEGFMISCKDRKVDNKPSKTASLHVSSGTSSVPPDTFSLSKDNSISGVELAEVGRSGEYTSEESTSKVSTGYAPKVENTDGMRSDTGHLHAARSGDWAQALDAFSQRKTQALAPEHLDNLWAKGRNYRKKDSGKKGLTRQAEVEPQVLTETNEVNEGMAELQDLKSMRTGAENTVLLEQTNTPVDVDNDFYGKPRQQSRVIMIGVDSIGVHSGSSRGASASRVIHHPLEIPETPHDKKSERIRHQRSKSSGGLERPDKERASSHFDMGRKRIGNSMLNYKPKVSCKVIGAHYEKIGSKSFAVYSISVSDAEDRTWVVLRRYRNFEQLHRRLRDMPHYTLSLPPKRFLSSNLDNSFVRERCILLNKYLKDLLSIPSIAELHEVWDFLSSKSQNYDFGESHSIIKTLAVNVDDAVDDVFRQIKGVSDGVLKTTTAGKKMSTSASEIFEGGGQYTGASSMWNNPAISSSVCMLSDGAPNSQASDDDGEDDFGTGWHSDSEVHNGHLIEESMLGKNALEASLSEGHSPVESVAGSEMTEDDMWSPPKLTVPLLNLVDIVFQLEGRGWIRRQVLWIAKQVLQLGMGDAIDDWLLTRVQYLRRGDVVASGIRWIQQILWPDGIFLTKHPKHQPHSASPRNTGELSFEERLEGARRAMVVRELIQERAPTALVNLIGRKQYQRCAKDIYGFLQSQVCIKQLAYSLLEKLLAAAFPELEELILETQNGAL